MFDGQLATECRRRQAAGGIARQRVVLSSWQVAAGGRRALHVFGCDGDFRPIGGPERVVMMEYRRAQLVRWGCEDRV